MSKFTKVVRERMRLTGESYVTARMRVMECDVDMRDPFAASATIQQSPPRTRNAPASDDGPVSQASQDTRRRVAEMTAKWPLPGGVDTAAVVAEDLGLRQGPRKGVSE